MLITSKKKFLTSNKAFLEFFNYKNADEFIKMLHKAVVRVEINLKDYLS